MRFANSRALQPGRNLARRAEGQRDCDCSETDTERTDVKPEIAAVRVIEPAARPGAERRAECGGQPPSDQHLRPSQRSRRHVVCVVTAIAVQNDVAHAGAYGRIVGYVRGTLHQKSNSGPPGLMAVLPITVLPGPIAYWMYLLLAT
jgi:hypothetical protein